MTVVEPPAPASLDDAGAAARARLDAALPQDPAGQHSDGSTPPPAPPAAAPPSPATPAGGEFDLFAPDALDNLNFDGLQYRDGQQLRGELATWRDRMKPYHEAFGALDDANRQAVLDGAKALGTDVAGTMQVLGGMHPDDRGYFLNAMQMMGDPSTRAEAADMLAVAVQRINESMGRQPTPDFQVPGTTPADNPFVDPDPAANPNDAPMTRGDYLRMQQEHDHQLRVTAEETAILNEARALGYDPQSQDPVDEARFAALMHLTGRGDITGGDVAKAHEVLEGWRQANIDEFVAAKSADAARPGVPADAGAPPAQPQQVETMDDAHGAMRARLDAAFGPDPRQRQRDD